MKICFLDNSPLNYDETKLLSGGVRGAEKALINLSKEFTKLGHKVTVLNNIDNEKFFSDIRWFNIKNYKNNESFDLAITNNDIRNFDLIKSSKKIAISHSIQSIEKFIRKRQLFSYLKHKPKIVILSDYHKKNRSFFLRLFGNFKLSWAVDDIFINTNISNTIDPNLAIFTSNKDRNLQILIDIWKEYIFPKDKSKKLLISSISADLTNFNIYNREEGSQISLIKDLLKSKIFLIPGHKAELFCLAAEEARELCIPSVTLGIGSLSERVIHGKTGFVAKNHKEFSEFALMLFNDQTVWNEIRSNLVEMRNKYTWKECARDFLKLI